MKDLYFDQGWYLASEQPVTILAKGLGSQTFELAVPEGGDFRIVLVTTTAMSINAAMAIGGEQVDVHLDQTPFEDQEVTIHVNGTDNVPVAATVKFGLYAYQDRASGRLFIYQRG